MSEETEEPGESGEREAGAAPIEPAPMAPGAAPDRGRRRTVVLAGIAVLAILTGVIAWGATRYSSVKSDLDDVSAIRSVAGDFGAAALTYDYRDLKPFEARMKAHATGTFRRQLGDGLAGLTALITGAKSSSEATVKQIYVGEVQDHAASAVVVVEARARNGDEAVRTLPAAYIELQLVEVGGRWLIDGVSTLDLGQAVSGASGAAGATTTTVAPAGPSK
jgi:hypothetical protein